MRLALAILLLSLGCDSARAPAPKRDAPAVARDAPDATAVAPMDAGLTPLGPEPFVDLEVEGFASAVVSVPRGATEPRPIVLATHGNYDRPEWQCHVWRQLAGDSAFVLCPRGVSRRDSPSPKDIRFTYTNDRVFEREIDAGLAALRTRFGAHVADGPIVYTGFSLGAIFGVAVMARGKGSTPYERAVLVEGGHDGWNPQTAKRYAAAGGKKILFACGQAGCFVTARKAAEHLERAGVQTRTVGVKDAGHAYDGPVASKVAEAWNWLLE